MSTPPLSQTELAALEAWLDSPLLSGKAMPIDKLHGFLCAVVSAPDTIPPSRWVPEAMGGEPAFESKEQAKELAGLMMRFRESVEASLQGSQPLELILRARSGTDQALDYETWCNGYILGWALSTEEWLRPGNEPLKKLTFPIMLLSGAFKEGAEARGEEFMPAAEYAALEQKCRNALPNAVAGIHDFWRTDKKAAPITRESPKVGRNEPCPCGSGKKFKQCCGSARILH